jgi:pimeloyl-ACP methyl ester carboxylesterase
MYKKLFYISLILLAATFSCMKLDVALYLYQDRECYALENHKGSTDIELPDSMYIEEENLHLIPMQSQKDSEKEPTTIYAVYIGDTNSIGTDTVIVYCHGQLNHIDFYYPRAKLLANCGHKHRFGVLIMDYRGYGMSEGKPDEEGMSADVDACLDWLKERGATTQNVVMYGFSLGTIPATDVTAYNTVLSPSKLILESPLASADYLGQFSMGFDIPASFIFEIEADNAEKIKLIDQPFLWLHGKEDSYLSIENGQVIYDNYQGEYKDCRKVDGAEHGENGVPHNMGIDVYLKTVEEFITR